MKKRTRRLIAVAVIVTIVIGFSAHMRVAYLATLVLMESVTPETDGPIASLRPAPVVEEVSFEVDGKTVVADLYRPARDGKRPGIVLSHGVAARGRNDPRLMNFADALARAGFVALVPEFTNMKEFRVRPTDIDELIASFEYLWLSPHVRTERIGLFGFSYAGGLAALSAADPRISDRVRFCFLLGAHCDLTSVVRYATTGMFRVEDEWVYLEPRATGKWAFLLNSIDLIEDEGDRELLSTIAERKFDDEDADVSDLALGLGDEGRGAYELMVNTDPERTSGLVAEMSERVREYFAELSPNGQLRDVRAHMILVHGRDDHLIPYTETLALAEQLPPEASVNLQVIESFVHVDLTLGGGEGLSGWLRSVGEALRLFSVTYDLMAQGYL
jgi:dienelactone hydrolase